MEFGASQIGLIGLAILASSIVQGAVGFAVALVAIPILLQAGLDLPQSIFVVLICAIVQNALGLRQTWKDTPIRNLWGWACWRAMLIPPGFLLMQWMESYSKSELRQLFGIILIIIIVLQLLFRPSPREKVHWGWTGLAISVSGVCQGMLGSPGPPIAFWVMAHDWDSRRSRGVMFFLFITGSLPHLVLLLLVFSQQTTQKSLLIAAAGIPLSLLGTSVGLWIGNRFDKRRIRLAILVTLVVLSLSLILFP